MRVLRYFHFLLMIPLCAGYADAQIVRDANTSKDKQIAPVGVDLVPTGKGWGELLGDAPAAITPSAMSCTTGHGINYHGGPIMPGTVNMYYIWYGNWVNGPKPSDSPASKNLLEALAGPNGFNGSGYMQINSTYCDNNNSVTGNAVLAQSTVDNYSHGTSLTDANIQAIVSSAIGTGSLPKDTNGVYFVLTSSDVNETSGFCTQYCGWHTSGTISGSDIKYSFVGNSDRCPSSCESQTTVSPNNNTGADGMASIIAHELEEAISDPDLNAWYDGQGAENADKCAWNFGPSQTLPNGSKYNQTLAGFNWYIQMNWQNTGAGFCAQTLDTSGGGCGATLALEGNPWKDAILGVLYRVRDQVLAKTPAGRRYADLYYKHAAEGAHLVASDPSIRFGTLMMMARFLPTFQAILAGRPANITAADQAALQGFLNTVSAKASPALRADLNMVQRELTQGSALQALGIASPRPAALTTR